MSIHDFNISSDFATLKNDSNGSVSLNIPTGGVISPNNRITYESKISVGALNASARTLMKSSATNVWYAGSALEIKMRARFAGSYDADTWQYVMLERVDATTFALRCSIFNNQVDSMQIIGGAQTITAEFDTYLSPFI